MRRNTTVLLGLACLFLSGCISTPKQAPAPIRATTTERAPVKERAATATQTGEEGISVRAYEPPSSVGVEPVHSKAVGALIEQAQHERAQGRLDAAVVTVERALRIEPRNAHLWNLLAHLRYEQGQRGLAADLAAKSNALAARDIQLKREFIFQDRL